MKENFFSRKMAEKPTEMLEQIIASKEFTEDAKLAASWELEKRGKSAALTVQPAPVEPAEPVDGKTGFSVNFDDDSILDGPDPGLPVLYRKGMIYLFCGLFSALFGTILYAMNLYTLRKMNAIYLALGFGVVYTILVVTTVAHLPRFSNLGLILNIAGGGILCEGFWNSQIGKEFRFTRRSVVIPLMIGIGISAVLLYFMFQSMPH